MTSPRVQDLGLTLTFRSANFDVDCVTVQPNQVLLTGEPRGRTDLIAATGQGCPEESFKAEFGLRSSDGSLSVHFIVDYDRGPSGAYVASPHCPRPVLPILGCSAGYEAIALS